MPLSLFGVVHRVETTGTSSEAPKPEHTSSKCKKVAPSHAHPVRTGCSMIKKLDKVFTGICLVVGFFVLAGVFHDSAVGEPWGWIAAFGLSAGAFAAGAVALALASLLLVYLPIRLVKGPAGSFRARSGGGIAIAAFGHRSMWGKLLSLGSADTSVIGTGHFSLVVDGRGLSFRRSGMEPDEIALVRWSQVESVAPAVITDGARRSNGISVTVIEPDRKSTIEFTCARTGVMNVYGRQPWRELEELCGRMWALKTAPDRVP
jgi:hypothetical protein